MSGTDDNEVLRILKDIRANQERQLEGSREALEMQREQVEMARACRSEPCSRSWAWVPNKVRSYSR
jgi:hypothetical protein